MTDWKPDPPKNLQVRVPKEYADKVAALARARGKTTGQLMRDAMDALIEEAQHDIEELRLKVDYLKQKTAIENQIDG